MADQEQVGGERVAVEVPQEKKPAMAPVEAPFRRRKDR
jgi:hypothetical protein